MHQIGLLGLGHYSTQFYLAQLNRVFLAQHGTDSTSTDSTGADSTCPLLMLNANFNEINRYLPQDYPQLNPVMTRYLTQMASLNVSRWIIPNVTLNEVVKQLVDDRENCPKIIDPMNCLIEALAHKGIDRVTIFGSIYTTHSTMMAQAFNEAGITLIKPEASDVLLLEHLRRDIYAAGQNESHHQTMTRLLNKYRSSSPVVIACSELSLACYWSWQSELTPLSDCFDMALLQIQTAVDFIS